MILAFVVGAATGGALFMLGFWMGLKVNRQSPQPQEERKLTPKEARELEQWDNLMRFTGRPQE